MRRTLDGRIQSEEAARIACWLMSNLEGLSKQERERRLLEANICVGFSPERGCYVDVIDTTGHEVTR